jgi:hypothetical protein
MCLYLLLKATVDTIMENFSIPEGRKQEIIDLVNERFFLNK